jgi:gamma-butyrobetaine dioxygenase
MAKLMIDIDGATGGLSLVQNDRRHVLHPLWVRERVTGEGVFDPATHQRLYEHADISTDIRITRIVNDNAPEVQLDFSDGERLTLNTDETLSELGWHAKSDALPLPKPWVTVSHKLSYIDWRELDNPDYVRRTLERYFKDGFCVFQNTPTEEDSLKTLARRFGYLRETNFGELFNVRTKPNPSDLAYTDVALASHTDNPYRAPVPGIQFLHCLRNDVSGGLSTLVDGMAIAQALRAENPEQADVLERVSVRFRYEGPSAILEHHGPLIERDHDGIIRQIRLSSRLDYVPALDLKTLSLFYKGRKRLHDMAGSPEFQISFPFRSGTLLMMDNYRLLHGRTAFNGAQGHRFLQGGYIDHDGPASLYRMLLRDGVTTSVKRED